MKVTTITAGISYSTQLPDGSWAKIELGAGASLDDYESDDWTARQVQIYAALKVQMSKLWPAKERQASNGQQQPEQSTPPAAPPPQQEQAACPNHPGKSKESQHGGQFCSARMADGTYCKWTSGRK